MEKRMKKQTIKNVQKRLKEREIFTNNKYGEEAISNKECESFVRNNEKAITLIALVITVIVLLILARHFDFNVKSAIIPYLLKQEKPK